MANLKISQLTTTTTPLATDLHVIVDTTDTTMAPSGTDKQITWANLLNGIASQFFNLTPTAVLFANGSGNPASDGTDFTYNSSTNVMTVPVALLKTGLRLEDTGAGTNTITLQSPTPLASSYTLTLPANDGTASQVLTTDGNGVLSWTSNSGGDVAGPGSSTDNALVRFDGTTGALVQNSIAILNDAGILSGLTQLNVGNLQLNANTIAATNTGGDISLLAGTGAQIIAFNNILSKNAIVFEETGVGTDIITMSAPASISGSYSFTLPATQGSAGQLLSTDGSGNSSWVSATGNVGSSGPSTDNAIARWDGSSGTLIQNSAVTIDDTGIINTTAAQIQFSGAYVLKTVVADNNVGVGQGALASVIAGGQGNTAVGRLAGTAITSGDNNTFVGVQAGAAATTAQGMTAIGALAGTLDTTTDNVYIGVQAGASNISDGSSVFIGARAGQSTNGSGGSLVIIGADAAPSCVLGPNVYIGNRAGFSNANGNGNVMVGAFAGRFSTNEHNTFIGNQAGQGSGTSSGNENTYVGFQTGSAVSTGSRNTALGSGAATSATTASDNVCLGYQAAGSLSTGSGNVVVGTTAMSNVTTGSKNIIVGNAIGPSGSNDSFNIVLGHNMTTAGSNGLWIGSSVPGEGVTTQSTVGGAGGASALPATPTSYLNLRINGLQYVIPLYPPA